jgi:hypothetical protein
MMKNCPKCGLPIVEGVVICDCGQVLKAVFGTETERVEEPGRESSHPSNSAKRKEHVGVSPILEYGRKKPRMNWGSWLIVFIILSAFRSLLTRPSNQPLFQPSSGPSAHLADNPLTAGFSLSSANGRFERLQEASLEILRKYLTREEYDFLIELSEKQNRNSVSQEEFNRVVFLMKKIDSVTTAEEKAKLAELRGLLRRLAGQMK